MDDPMTTAGQKPEDAEAAVTEIEVLPPADDVDDELKPLES